MKKVDIAILGSGIAGLAAALKARELGRNAVIFESKLSSGGLLDNFSINGFRFDQCVHLSFAKEEKVRAIFDKTKYFTHSPESQCFENNKWFKHPIQNNLYPLKPEEKVELINSFLERPSKMISDNYDSWLRYQYGDKIAERYPIKYTFKYWDTSPKKLSTTWIGNRMRKANVDEILYGAFTEATPNTYYTSEMRYPKKGGFKGFIQPLIDASTIFYNHKAINVDTNNKTIKFENNEVIQYKTLVSSIPLPMLALICAKTPKNVIKAASKLCSTSVDLISIGFNKKVVNKLWFYIYDEDIFASRAYSPSKKSPDNAPPHKSSIQFEIYQRGINSKYKKNDLIKNCKYALKKLKIGTPEDILFIDHRRVDYGNVVFDVLMEKSRDIVRDHMSSKGIKLCGRFGEWDYFWTNQSFLSGYNAI